MTRIAEGLAKYFHVHVLCGQPYYQKRRKRSPNRESRNGVHIQRVPAIPFNNNVLILKFLNMLTLSFSIFVQTFRLVRKRDIVFFTNLPPVVPFFTAAACRLRGAYLIMRIDDVYPDCMGVAGMIFFNSFLYRLLDWSYKILYRSVHTITVLGRDTQQLLALKLHGVHPKIFFIPNSAILTDVYPIPRDRNTLLQELGLTTKFVIKYAGHMGRTHGLEYLLGAVENLKSRSDIHFLFIGSGPRKKWLEETVNTRRLDNVTIISYRPRSEICISVNACDVGIIAMARGMSGVSVPGRIYDLLAAGKPVIVIAEEDSELAFIVREENIGWIVPPGNIDKLEDAILTAKDKADQLADIGQRARLVAESKYSVEREIQRYRILFNSVLNQNS